ncbi:MAG: bifunctional methylenetetrahydrofolate dehydrogenase/methenyltetrahydrofolate cyclohydrolase FolD, partial [Actinomycetia bacterium]|nr:bifunctional methylenetetrahydrofolate dehydrogenase/methenyltetrahydrofolate cyclohydrolase FolD [Actinomycetes bacterium]
MAKLISGPEIAKDIKAEVAEEVKEIVRLKGVKPGLSVILVGDDPASKVYVRNKQLGCEQVGFKSETIRMDESVSTEDLLKKIDNLNHDPSVHGILVQLPLPPQVDQNRVLESIFPEKDVDGFHPMSMGRLVAQQDCLVPATPSGIIEMLKRKDIKIKGKEAVIVGRSVIVGRPMALLLINESATVTVCHTKTRDMGAHTRDAEILIVSAGRPNLIGGDMVSEGTVVIDVGINRILKDQADPEILKWRKDDFEKKGATLIGDVNFLEVEPKASYITPVPGGVGPMTIAMLLKNTLKAAKMQLGLK